MKRKLLIFLVIFNILILSGCSNVTTTSFESTTTLNEKTEYYSLLSNVIAPKRMLLPDEKEFDSIDEYIKRLNEYEKSREERMVDDIYLSSFNSFFLSTLEEFILDETNTNTLYSPLNIYLALSILYETTSGESKDELSSLLKVDDEDDFKNVINKIFDASYENEDDLKVLLSNSLWLSDLLDYKDDCVKKLGDYYYSYVYEGRMGSYEYTAKLKDYVNANTNHMLEEYVKDLELTKETVYAIVSTIYFKGSWSHAFSEYATRDDTFHLGSEDITFKFMNKEYTSKYYTGDNFTSVSDYFSVGDFKIDYILPDEEENIDDFIKSESFKNFLVSKEGVQEEVTNIRLSIPKFDVSGKLNLIDHLKNLGVNDIFSPATSNFSSITDLTGLYIDKIEHAARVKIDEEGLEAAAYTFIGNKATSVGPKEYVDFKLDRAFIFVLRNTSGMPLFIGVINNPSVTK